MSLSEVSYVEIKEEMHVMWFLMMRAADLLHVDVERLAFRVAILINRQKAKPHSMGKDLESIRTLLYRVQRHGTKNLDRFMHAERLPTAVDAEYLYMGARALLKAPPEWVRQVRRFESVDALPLQEPYLPLGDRLTMSVFVERLHLVPRRVLKTVLKMLVTSKGSFQLSRDDWNTLVSTAQFLPRCTERVESLYDRFVNPAKRSGYGTVDLGSLVLSWTTPSISEPQEPPKAEVAAKNSTTPHITAEDVEPLLKVVDGDECSSQSSAAPTPKSGAPPPPAAASDTAP